MRARQAIIRAGRSLLLCGAVFVLLTAPVRGQTGPSAGAPDGGFVSGVEDLPLMAGLTEDTGAGLVFDKPSGRIVEAFATGAVNRAAVIGFYAETLPQLGWQPAGDATFAREDEILRIEISGADGALTVRFSLSPK